MTIKQLGATFAIIGLLFGMAQVCNAELQIPSLMEWLKPSSNELEKQAEPNEFQPQNTADYSDLSAKVADSMKDFLPKNIKNIAIWRIDGNRGAGVNVEALKDSLEVAIVKGRKLSLIDRTKLDLIFQEQGLSQTGLVDPAKMKKIGKLYGLDAIIFIEILQNKIDRFENPTIIVKAIDTETGLLSYSAEFSVLDKYMKTEIDDLYSKFVNSMNNDKQQISNEEIDTIAFWQIDSALSGVDTSTLISKLSNYFVNSKAVKIIDRENLKELLSEQAFGSSGLVDVATAKRLGKLYGVDAFIFGNVKDWEGSEKGSVLNANIKVSLKMINVNTAQIVWADELQGSFSESKKDIYAFFGEEYKEPVSWTVPAARSAIFPGWGQMVNGQKQKGLGFMGLEVLTIGAAYYAHTQYVSAWNKYLGATTRADMDKYYDEAYRYDSNRKSLIYLAIGVWLWNIYDAGINCNVSTASNVYILPQEDKMLIGARMAF